MQGCRSPPFATGAVYDGDAVMQGEGTSFMNSEFEPNDSTNVLMDTRRWAAKAPLLLPEAAPINSGTFTTNLQTGHGPYQRVQTSLAPLPSLSVTSRTAPILFAR